MLLTLLSRSSRVGMLAILGVLPLLASCESNSQKPDPKVDDRDVYWGLQLNHQAVTLSMTAPYDTLRLVATPQNYVGEPLAGLPAPTFVSKDLEKVIVTEDGLLVAIATTSQPVKVIATLTTGNLRHEDTVVVHIVAIDPPPVLVDLSIHPLPPDSAKYSVVQNVSLGIVFPLITPRVIGPNGVAFNTLVPGGIPVSLRSSKPRIVSIDHPSDQDGVDIRQPRRLWTQRPGHATLYASATAFGVKKVDTLPYQVGWPVQGRIDIGTPNVSPGVVPGTFLAPEVTIGVGGVILWFSLEAFSGTVELPNVTTTDVVFDEGDLPNIAPGITAGSFMTEEFQGICFFFPADCGNAGNAMITPSTVIAARVFTAPGTYRYHSTIHGTSGRIVVVDEQ